MPDATIFLSQHKGETELEREIKNPRKWFETSLKKAGIPVGIKDVHWHTLRHTFASRLVIAGVSLDEVSELMGHTTLEMTKRYAHLANKNHQEALAVLVPVVASPVAVLHSVAPRTAVHNSHQNSHLTKTSASKKQTAGAVSSAKQRT